MKYILSCLSCIVLLCSCSEKKYLCHCESVYRQDRIGMELKEETVTTISAYSEGSAKKKCESSTHTSDTISTYDRTCKIK